MSKSNVQETAYLKLLYQNIAMANIGDAAGLQPSATAGNFYVALYTDDPTDADTGTEANYTSYARVAVPRSTSGWTVSGNVVSNATLITFPVSTGGANTLTHFGIHTASTGGDLIGSGALSSTIEVTSTKEPKIEAGALTHSED